MAAAAATITQLAETCREVAHARWREVAFAARTLGQSTLQRTAQQHAGVAQQTDWDAQLPHVERAYNNSVSPARRLVPNEVYLGRLPRLPLTVVDLSNIGGHQSLNRDQLAYIELATGCLLYTSPSPRDS